MSHFVTIKTQIKDIEALRAACKDLNLQLLQNAEARGYGTKRERAAHVIQLNGPFDIAVHPERDGTHRLSTDWWDGHVEREVGKSYGRLLQLYGAHKATREAHKRGLTVHWSRHTHEAIKLTIGGL